MRAVELFNNILDIPINYYNINIEYITDNSRNILKNSLFIAKKGITTDGHNYIKNALNNGAVLAITEKKIDLDIPYIICENIKELQWKLTNRLYNFPSSKLNIIGVTGTNGKTTITFIIQQLLEKFNIQCARIGTIGHFTGKKNIDSVNTSPDTILLQNILYSSVKDKSNYLVMEVSSHALELGRVEKLLFDIAVFTNCTQEHLDFHKTIDNYFNAKLKLFELTFKNNGKAIINIDDKYGMQLFEKFRNKMEIITIGKSEQADIRFFNETLYLDRSEFKIEYKNIIYDVFISIPAYFNIYNVLEALASMILLRFNIIEIIELLSKIKPVKGRFEFIKNKKDLCVIVDYAHTPDSLEKLLNSALKIEHKRIIIVFGCGGDRDKTKRNLMGNIACKLADHCIITSDNPRTEDPLKIINDIIPKNYNNYEIIGSREKAIKKAVTIMEKNDILIIAGKGHENYQIIGTEKIHFDDSEIVIKYLENK